MERTPDRLTNVPGMLLAGRWRYIDFEGAQAQLVDISWELGEPVCRFLDMEAEDAEVTLDPRDMAGRFEPAGPQAMV